MNKFIISCIFTLLCFQSYGQIVQYETNIRRSEPMSLEDMSDEAADTYMEIVKYTTVSISDVLFTKAQTEGKIPKSHVPVGFKPKVTLKNVTVYLPVHNTVNQRVYVDIADGIVHVYMNDDDIIDYAIAFNGTMICKEVDKDAFIADYTGANNLSGGIIIYSLLTGELVPVYQVYF